MENNPQIGSATGMLLLKADHGSVDSTGLQMNKARRAFDRGAGSQQNYGNSRVQYLVYLGRRRCILDG